MGPDGPLETTLQCGDTKRLSFRCPAMIVTIFFEAGHKKMISGQKTAFLGPERATLGNRGHETVRRAAKRPPTGKPKVSRVTSGYGGLMIPLSRDRLSRKNGGFIGVRTRLNGIISPPYPEATLDNFGFPVGGRLAARRAVFRPPGRILAISGHSPVTIISTLNFGPRSTKLGGTIRAT